MKTNKKAILGFAIAMIFSLAILQGINPQNSQQQNMNLQQVGAGSAYASGITESGVSSVLEYVSNYCLTISGGMTLFGISTFYVTGTTPVGWAYWSVDALVAL